MLRKSTLMALAATAALGLAILTPNMADARGHGGGGHGGGHGMHRGGHGGGHGMHRSHRRHFGHHRHRGHRHHRWHRHRFTRWHRPFWYAAPVSYAAAPVAGPCTCLTKEYTPEGSVLFKDICTNEAAINPPVMAPAPAAELQQPQAAYVPQYPPQYPPQAAAQ
jgi:hypothetical protein